jgi:hypothetical protein
MSSSVCLIILTFVILLPVIVMMISDAIVDMTKNNPKIYVMGCQNCIYNKKKRGSDDSKNNWIVKWK